MWPLQGLGFLPISFLTMLLIAGESLKREEKMVLEPVPGFEEWSPCEHGLAYVEGTASIPWWFSGLAEVPGVPVPVVSPLKMQE